MARPNKDPEDKRDLPIQLKFSSTEYSYLSAVARRANTEVTKLVRGVIDEMVRRETVQFYVTIREQVFSLTPKEFEDLERQVKRNVNKLREYESTLPYDIQQEMP